MTPHDKLVVMQLCYQSAPGTTPGPCCSSDKEHSLSHMYTCLLTPLRRTGVTPALRRLLEDPASTHKLRTASMALRPFQNADGFSVLASEAVAAFAFATSQLGLLDRQRSGSCWLLPAIFFHDEAILGSDC